MKDIPVIIPSYEPNERLINVVNGVIEAGFKQIIVVNDGSGEKYDSYFDRVAAISEVTVLSHEHNKGKGRALKTAFEYCLSQGKELVGCVTADSDGQHLPEDIKSCALALKDKPSHLILGVRNFDGDNIPDKSKFGNNLTKKVFKTLFKTSITDTQTGLRGIPAKLMTDCLDITGERFEFETNMLIHVIQNKHPMHEVEIATVYEDKDNHATHFRPVKDSVIIYSLLLASFFKFVLSSVSASVIDLVCFQLLCIGFRDFEIGGGITF